ncbi:ketoacyl-synt-domain-containing protein [Aspergillus eucalypticola CBS 122712]|uniref:Ketoacyl-synt-domain-containing protein n=1 Tax=Aspergillus eucalypticola (strain CBS 122712 / IBT 29274) TaxID=1448314 RepID=A0A317UXY8_ASPEC|nr:ketoacyl-synt-domain-containing protein [Aspergillus eucalypticola CBS 122712]PWY66913.1 ketoacyl-synt-domain-containing protein [Aspergillus eucalypticola CBS 122712]
MGQLLGMQVITAAYALIYHKPPSPSLSSAQAADSQDRPPLPLDSGNYWKIRAMSLPSPLLTDSMQMPTTKLARPGMIVAPEAYFLQEDIRTFDAPFFKISPPEAATMDPQQRLLMEVVYESLERAGLPLQHLQGSSTGVYCGSMSNYYQFLTGADSNMLRPFSLIGTTPSILANRISYFFDWHGPSFVLDTACSSSLVALHLAAEALHNGDCSLAVVVGSNLILSPDPFIGESQMQMLSPTGRCRMWDAHADGYARGEGVASLVLKRLQDAVADGDPNECVIRSTGINPDRRTEALTLPNGEAQRDLIRSTYARAGLNPLRREDRCQFFEAHGTGTLAGDPQEAFGISSVFFDDSSPADDNLYVGSIKSVAGHAEGTAGVAGVLKASLAIQHGIIPPNLLFNELSPLVAPYTSHLRVPTQALSWPDLPSGSPRRVSVNSFGFGGANAHVILGSFEGAPSSSTNCEHVTSEILPFVFSAASEASLTAVLRNCVKYLEEHPAVNLLELAASLLKKRSTLSHRLFFTAGTIESLREALNSEVQRRSADMSATITRRLTPGSKKILGVFTGQGAQWPQMGLDVISQCSLAQGWMKELQQALDTLPVEYKPTFTLLDELSAPDATSRLNSAAVSLPVRTALQIIKVNILWSLGIELAAVVGHSSGEIGAAYAARRLTLRDAIRIAYLRGMAAQHAGSQGKSGAMLAVDAMCSETAHSGTVVVAAFNSPTSVTFSGDSDLITELEWIIESLGYSARRLRVDTAYHSSHMIPCADPYVQSMKQCQIQARQSVSGTKWFSSVFEGQVMDNFDIQYWSNNMLRPVLFSQALTAAMKELSGLDAIVEVGPHAALQGPTMQILSAIKPDEADIPYFEMANRKFGGIKSLALAVGSFWANLRAETLDVLSYIRLFSPSMKLNYLVDIPTYPWDHSQRYWAVPHLSSTRINRQHPIHPLLGFLPIFHLFSSLWTHLFPIRYGEPLYLLRDFQFPLFLSTVHQYQITETYLVPAMVHMLNQAPPTQDVKTRLSSLRYIGVAGAPIDRASMSAFQDLLHPDACAGQVWDQDKVIWEVLDLSLRGGEARLVSGAEVVKDDGWWFDMGDVAYIKNGEYFIVGRTKELIKVRGYQVCPAEIEAVLLQHPLIADVAVIGTCLSDGSSEAPRAYVVRARAPGARVSSDEVYDFARQRLAAYKALDGGVFFVERIPRTVSGKNQRGKLASMNERRDTLAGLLARFKTKDVGGVRGRVSVVV